MPVVTLGLVLPFLTTPGPQDPLADRLTALAVAPPASVASSDYLLQSEPFVARALRSADGDALILDNGLLRRTWLLAPNGACIGLDNLMTGESMLRSIRPEARVTIDGVALQVGGLQGQANHAFLLPEELSALESAPGALRLVDLEIGATEERFGWVRPRNYAPGAIWPPPGVRVRMDYAAQGDSADLRVSVHYELYDGIPVMSKWITVDNLGAAEVTLDAFTGEELALVELAESRRHADHPHPTSLHLETDFAFGSGDNSVTANRHVVHWRRDPSFTSQVEWSLDNPSLLLAEPTFGPAQRIAPGGSFEGFRAFELLHDRGGPERRGLALRRMYRTLAPWVTENPLTHHLLSHDPERVMAAIEEAAEVGFEALILSFGSGFNMENRDPEFLSLWRAVADHAEARGIELGCYSLFSSRGVGPEHMIVSPEGQRPTHGQCPAVTSEWGLDWLDTIRAFYRDTGFDQFENDGPYPGDVDVTPRPPLQVGAADSRWTQWRLTSELYRDLRGSGVYINAPEWYYLGGSNKCGMGYREVNWSLPRAQQVLHTRQNIYDGTWAKTPSMGWMHVPLAEYQGGGPAATIEPLHENLDHYERMLLSNLGMGVQGHYRGPRLFDTSATRDRVRTAVDWFKRHRDILESDVIHGRRADGRDLDWILHANPALATPGMLCVYNPLDHDVTRTLVVDVYYTGLADSVRIDNDDQEPRSLPIDRDHRARIEVTVPAGGMAWWTLEQGA